MIKSACGHNVLGEEFEKRKQPGSAVIDTRVKSKRGLCDITEERNLRIAANCLRNITTLNDAVAALTIEISC